MENCHWIIHVASFASGTLSQKERGVRLREDQENGYFAEEQRKVRMKRERGSEKKKML